MDEKFVNLDIQNDKTLLAACDLLHDAYFDISKTQYNKAQGVLQMPFEREFCDPLRTEYHKFLIFAKITFPLVLSVLTLKNIKSYNLEDHARIGRYTFNECQIKGNDYKLVFCENMTIYLTFSQTPLGRLTDQHFLNKKASLFMLRNPFRKT